MRQILCKRLEALEQVAAAERARKTSTVSPGLQNLLARLD
jgi:hypothetical protein